MRYVFSDYTLDTRQYELRRAGVPIALRPKLFHLLTYLLAHRDHVVPRQELCEHLWPKQFVSDATLDACLAQARQAVGDCGHRQRFIQTRHGYGYRFVAAVEVLDDPPGEADGRSTLPTSAESVGVEPAPVRVGATGGPALMPHVPGQLPTAFAPLHPPYLHALAGERKVVTVLVCTLANAALWAQRLEAEALHHCMQAFFGLVLEEVERYGGTLQRVLDDGVLVLFGAPLAQEDHAQRAVLAALGLLQRLRVWCPEPPGQPEVLVVHMGLHTGQIIIGSLSDSGRPLFTPVGDTTQRATWLAQAAPPSTILVSDALARLVRGAVRLEARCSLPTPGQANSEPAYKVLGLSARRTPPLKHAARPLSPFVGRQLELATLRALLTRVEGHQGQVVSLVGEPGMGKTRLVHEFWQSLGPTRVTYLEGRCVSYGEAIPYLPVCELLQQLCGLSEGESPQAITTHVHQHLQANGMVSPEEAPYLLHLLGVPDATAGLAGVNPQTIRIRTFGALHQLLLRQSQRQPLLVVVENLHWIDPTSQEYLAELVEQLAGLPLLLLVTFRPGYRPAWMDKSYATQLTLARLSPEDSQRVVQAVLSTPLLSEQLLQDILAKAAGNPLFLEELAWAVREHGDLRLPPEIPTTVQAVLAARIDRLPPEAKQLLQTAAVIGPEVPRPLLQAVAGLSEEDLQGALRQLQGAEFLYETRLIPEGVYTFKHALTHEVAYGSLLQKHRRTLHARIVEALEAHCPDRLADRVEWLAHHAFWGEVWDKAVAYGRQAGAKAATQSAYREAVASIERALAALQHLPGSRELSEQAIDLRLDLRSALLPLAAYERMTACLRDAQALAEALGDQRRLGRVLSYLAHLLQRLHAYDRAVESGRRALTIAVDLGDLGLQVATNFFLGQIHSNLGHYREATSYFRSIIDALEGDGLRDRFGMVALPAVQARSFLAGCLSALGAFAEGIRYAEEAVQIAKAVDHPYSLIDAYLRGGHLDRHKGEVDKAIAAYEHSRALSQDAKIPVLHINVTFGLGSAYTLAGRVDEAIPLLEQAVEQALSMPFMPIYSQRLAALSEAYLLAGRLDKAMQQAQHALELAREYQELGNQAGALWLLGEIAARREPSDIEHAEYHYRQALTLAEALGMRPLQAHCRLGLGTLYVKVGRLEQAHAALSSAIELYRAMDMTFWLPQAEAALTQLRSSLVSPMHRKPEWCSG